MIKYFLDASPNDKMITLLESFLNYDTYIFIFINENNKLISKNNQFL